MLHSDEVGPDQRNVVNLAEYADDTSMINTGNENGEEIGEKSRLLLQVKCQGLVVTENG